MKKLALVTALALAAMITAPAQAASNTGTFNSVVTLTPACVISGGTNMAFNYTSFGAVQNPTATINVKCTNTLAYSLALSSPNPVAGTTTVLGLNYSLALTGAGTTGGGTGVDKAVTITGTMAAGQSGTCSAVAPATCTATEVHTLTVSY